MEFEDNFEKTMDLLNEIEKKLEKKVKLKEESKRINNFEKKNSHLHLMIGTEEKKKLMEKAEKEGIAFSEWCRKKLREENQLDRIEKKLDKISEKVITQL